MFYIYVTVYEILQKNGCTIYEGGKDVFDGLEIHDPTEVVQLFRWMPDNSEMYVYNPLHGDSYRFRKGGPLKYREDTDIDLFTRNYGL